MDQNDQQAKQELILDLNFVPTWARESPAVNPYAHFDRGGGDHYRGGGGGDRPDRNTRRRDTGRPGGARRPPPGGGGGDRRGSGDRFRGGAPAQGRDERPASAPSSAPSQPRYQPSAEESLPLEIHFIPERQRLAALVRDLQVSHRAYPLMDLASRFLSNPDCYLVKLEVRPSSGSSAHKRVAQCKECKMLFWDRESVLNHALAAHLDKFFDMETIQTDPPTGNFLCVARCRRSGVLLGPPNHHGYNEKLQELYKTRFSHLSIDEYRASIETVKDADLIEKWKQECTTQTVYKLKGQENAVPMKKAEAEKHFMEHCAGSFFYDSARLIMPASVAQKMEDARLRNMIRDAWQRESRFPFTLSLALRPAFRHMRLFLFKVKGGQTFVSHIHPKPLDAQHVVEPIREVLKYLKEHPGCTRQDLLGNLRPDVAPESPEAAELLKPFRWLIERGHVIEFFNGTLAVPSSGSQRQEPRRERENREEDAQVSAPEEASAIPIEPEAPSEPT
ncbi:MAG: hypothetical protein V2A34_04515 [Lentisphaerota bacterium]